MAQGILLTGATGLLGRYLLRDLLASGYTVGVLLRSSSEHTAQERLDELVDFGSETLKRKLPRPMLLEGDLCTPGLGLDERECVWLSANVNTVIHAAAYVSYQPTPDGEPWETNVNGLYRLLQLCRALGIASLHHVSTAFISGDRRGTVYENELDIGNGSPNAYEQSKFAAEQLLRDFPDIQATIYRPSIIVGDSRTGYTSTYHHFYRFLELAVRLAGRTQGRESREPRRLAIRLPLSGEEGQNFVPVDWVSQAMLALLRQPRRHGQTYHLVAPRAVSLREVSAILQELLHFEGLNWVGPHGVSDPTSIEQMVAAQFEEYWSYIRNDVIFDSQNTLAALPDLPPPVFDKALVARLLRFAEKDGWGRKRSLSRGQDAPKLAYYLEEKLPAQMRRSSLAKALPCGLIFALDVRGLNGGIWSCHCGEGDLTVQPGSIVGAALTYRMDARTLEKLIQGKQSAQQAFFDGLIEIDGDVEKALKLAMLLEEFLHENAGGSTQPKEQRHAALRA